MKIEYKGQFTITTQFKKWEDHGKGKSFNPIADIIRENSNLAIHMNYYNNFNDGCFNIDLTPRSEHDFIGNHREEYKRNLVPNILKMVREIREFIGDCQLKININMNEEGINV